MGDKTAFKRNPFLVTYWKHGAHRVYDLLSRSSHDCSLLAIAILDASEEWTNREAILSALPQWRDEQIESAIRHLIGLRLLDVANRAPASDELAYEQWANWHPVASFFHAATHDLAVADPEAVVARASRLLVENDVPPTLKDYADRPHILLPPVEEKLAWNDALRDRRTWREFGRQALSLSDLSTLLFLTFGVQRWLEAGPQHWVPLKTSPSAGARHSIEAYVFAINVQGLQDGTYHYDPESHALSLLSVPARRELLAEFMPTQTGFHDCAVFIVMTSVFARVRWKYGFAAAYRVILLDAGHLGQTFALVSTAAGLAPFCTAAIDAPRIEKHLGLDGINEGVIFSVGVGPRPPEKDWAPMHDHSPPPPTRAAAWARRLPSNPIR